MKHGSFINFEGSSQFERNFSIQRLPPVRRMFRPPRTALDETPQRWREIVLCIAGPTSQYARHDSTESAPACGVRRRVGEGGGALSGRVGGGEARRVFARERQQR